MYFALHIRSYGGTGYHGTWHPSINLPFVYSSYAFNTIELQTFRAQDFIPQTADEPYYQNTQCGHQPHRPIGKTYGLSPTIGIRSWYILFSTARYRRTMRTEAAIKESVSTNYAIQVLTFTNNWH